MHDSKPDYLDCDPDVVAGLVQTVSTALLSNFPKIIADPYDIEMLVDALRVLRPNLNQLDTFDALRHMLNARWEEAIHVLTRVAQTSPDLGYGGALLAFCLVAVGSPEWRQVASQALADAPSPESRALIEAIQARDDFLNAVLKLQRGGGFTVPASCERYAFPEAHAARGDSSQAVQHASAGDETKPQWEPDHQYLRV